MNAYVKWLLLGFAVVVVVGGNVVNLIDNIRASDIAEECADAPWRVFGSGVNP